MNPNLQPINTRQNLSGALPGAHEFSQQDIRRTPLSPAPVTFDASHLPSQQGGAHRTRWLMNARPAFMACLLGAAASLLPGCQHSAQQLTTGQIVGPKLDTRATVYSGIPPDAFYKKELAIDSGRQTAELVRDNFAKYVRRAYVGRHVETFAEALETARKYNCTYLTYPWLLQWEDHATEFSGFRDKVEIKLEVADVQSGQILHATTIKGTGPWMTSGGESPRDILREPVAKYVASLFQVIHTPTALPKGSSE